MAVPLGGQRNLISLLGTLCFARLTIVWMRNARHDSWVHWEGWEPNNHCAPIKVVCSLMPNLRTSYSIVEIVIFEQNSHYTFVGIRWVRGLDFCTTLCQRHFRKLTTPVRDDPDWPVLSRDRSAHLLQQAPTNRFSAAGWKGGWVPSMIHP